MKKHVRLGIKYKEFQFIYEKEVHKPENYIQIDNKVNEPNSPKPLKRIDFYA